MMAQMAERRLPTRWTQVHIPTLLVPFFEISFEAIPYLMFMSRVINKLAKVNKKLNCIIKIVLHCAYHGVVDACLITLWTVTPGELEKNRKVKELGTVGSWSFINPIQESGEPKNPFYLASIKIISLVIFLHLCLTSNNIQNNQILANWGPTWDLLSRQIGLGEPQALALTIQCWILNTKMNTKQMLLLNRIHSS